MIGPGGSEMAEKKYISMPETSEMAALIKEKLLKAWEARGLSKQKSVKEEVTRLQALEDKLKF